MAWTVVADEAERLRRMADFLAASGWQVRRPASGAEAAKLLRAIRCDALVDGAHRPGAPGDHFLAFAASMASGRVLLTCDPEAQRQLGATVPPGHGEPQGALQKR